MKSRTALEELELGPLGNTREPWELGGWKSMEIDGNRWKSMEIDGNRWKSMAIDGNRWKSMEIGSTGSHGEMCEQHCSHAR